MKLSKHLSKSVSHQIKIITNTKIIIKVKKNKVNSKSKIKYYPKMNIFLKMKINKNKI